MTGLSARSALRGLLVPVRNAPLLQYSSMGISSINFGRNIIPTRTISICASPRRKPHIGSSMLSLYDARCIIAPATSSRAFSIWPISTKTSVPKGSPDVIAAGEYQPASTSSTTQVDSSSFDASSIDSISSDIASNMADATEKVQTLADLGQLSNWPNVRAAQSVLDWMTEATGLPWWATIALVTVMVRVLVLPLVFKGQANAIRLANISPAMQSHMKNLNYAKVSGNQRLMIESVTATQKLLKENNCHPAKSLITPLILMPLFITFFFAVRGLAEAGISSMTTGGLFWFTNLTAPDPLAVLPVLSAGMSLLILETGAEMGGTDSTQAGNPQAKMIKNVLRILTVVFIPVLWNFPAAVFCFWVTNNTFSLIQLFALRQPSVRKALKLPKKINHSADDLPKGKAMGFWESVGAGKTSQTIDTRRANNSVPSALQTKRQLEEGREAALQRLMMQQDTQATTQESVRPGLVNLDQSNFDPSPESSPVETRQVDAEIIETDEAPAQEIDEKERASIRREEEKRKRVQEARVKRTKKRRPN